MVAKSIIKLIDEAVIPALILIVAKMLGLYLTSAIFNLPFEVKMRSFLGFLPALHFANLTSYITAENYSNLAMFLAVCLGTIFVLIRAHFFHTSHIHPNLHAKLERFNLQALVAPSYHLYHQAVIWLLFLWITVGFLTLSTIRSITYPQITIVAFIIAANFSWVLAIDIEREVEITREV